MTIKKIVLANPRGFCAGVDRAIEIVEKALEIFPATIYVFHELVHNRHVVNRLSRNGSIFVNDLNEIPDDSICIYSAHGVSPKIRSLAQAKRLKVIDATCPLVTKVHLEAIRFTKEGYSLILIGHPGHEEVDGTMGEAPMQLVSSVEDVKTLEVSNPEKLIYLTQTTLSLDDTNQIIEALKVRFPHLETPPKEDICYATQNRQNSVKEIAGQVDLMLVVGSSNSSNSQRLKEAAQGLGIPSYLINDEKGIDKNWLENINVVGVTAGASAPEEIVRRVVDHLQSSKDVEVEGLELQDEHVQFVLPRELIQLKNP